MDTSTFFRPGASEQVDDLEGGSAFFPMPRDLVDQGGGGQPLPRAVRVKMERLFGTCFSQVRVHVGSQATAIGARAFAHGSSLYFTPGQYRPTTRRGLRLLGHELTHVLQQRAGRIPSPRGSGLAVLHDPALEGEAHWAGALVADGLPVPSTLPHLFAVRNAEPAKNYPIQACFYCRDLTCHKGEKCNLSASFGGLFPPGTSTTSPHVGPHKETKKFSEQYVKESEHMVPALALKKGHVPHNLNEEPTISIP